jgi:hypothetical protein
VAAICGHFLFQHFHSQSSSLWKRVWKGIADAGSTSLERRSTPVDRPPTIAHQEYSRA